MKTRWKLLIAAGVIALLAYKIIPILIVGRAVIGGGF
jgi:hypothetical protein